MKFKIESKGTGIKITDQESNYIISMGGKFSPRITIPSLEEKRYIVVTSR